MEINVLKKEKSEIIFEIDNVTIAEILRVYLAEDSSVDFVAWKREHLTKKPVVKIKTSGKDAKKILDSAVDSVTKDLDKVLEDFKKVK
jgi:DNA-directed RNA polymerase subunit L